MKIALLQLNVNDQPADNLARTLDYAHQAAAQGAQFILTPECTNILSSERAYQQQILQPESTDPTLRALRDFAHHAKIWLLIGSLCLKNEGGDGRFANRSFLIGPDGAIAARYDKIHMFDVIISEQEIYRESAAYCPGNRAVLANTPFAKIGLSVCYDVRFAALHRRLAQAGAQILTVPAAFNRFTGAAHWEILLRARAIETGCFVLAPAQTGHHHEQNGKGRQTYGHSLVIAPWGEMLLDAGTQPGAYMAEIDPAQVEAARARVPSLYHDRLFDGP